jgi:hypothetical protein
METSNLIKPKSIPMQSAPALYPEEENSGKVKAGTIQFSFFSRPVQNTIPSCTIGVKEVMNLITSRKYATTTEVLRNIDDPERARNFKARNFDYCCFSGVFRKRCESGLIKHSNLITIDFDHVRDVELLKMKLINDHFFETVLAFISPSGDGLKWIIKIDLNQNTHLEWFLALQRYIRYNYQLEIDQSGKDISRCCFLPYDPEVFVNKKYIQ